MTKKLLGSIFAAAMLVCSGIPAMAASVVDTNGNYVGEYLPGGPNPAGYGPTSLEYALRHISNTSSWVAIPVDQEGFVTDLEGIQGQIYFSATGCTGTEYIVVPGTTGTSIKMLAQNPVGQADFVDSNDKLYYADGAGEYPTTCSYAWWNSSGDENGCFSYTCGNTHLVAPVATFDLTTLSLTAPFTLTY